MSGSDSRQIKYDYLTKTAFKNKRRHFQWWFAIPTWIANEQISILPDNGHLYVKIEAFNPPANDHARRIDRRRALALSLGAGALALGIGGYVVVSGGSAEAFETGVGEQHEIDLSDGSRVRLNASSRLETRVTSDRREARLLAEEATRLYRLAAEQGHATAQYNLGWCYANGTGVAQDYRAAMAWYRRAAEQD